MVTKSEHCIRWMIPSDYPHVIAIDWDAYDDPLDDADLVRIMGNNSTIGIVIEPEYGTIHGYCIYRLYPDRIEIIRLAVDEKYRRQGFGRQMIERVKSTLARNHRVAVVASVDEWSLTLQLLFQSCGFVAASSGSKINFVYRR